MDNYIPDKDDYIRMELTHLAEVEKSREEAKNQLGELLNLNIWNFLHEDLDIWIPVGVVEIKMTDERKQGYSQYLHCKVIDEKEPHLYMQHFEDDVEYWVWQTVGYFGDDYSGFMLFPLSNGKYWKISYEC